MVAVRKVAVRRPEGDPVQMRKTIAGMMLITSSKKLARMACDEPMVM